MTAPSGARRPSQSTTAGGGIEAAASKAYYAGTHRICPPETTLAKVDPCLSRAGITRIANVTGLDRIGLPVVMVVRPNAKSISVSQGKGATLAAAKASGVMEALEAFVAETAELAIVRAPLADPPAGGRAVDWRRLPRHDRENPSPDMVIGWCPGTDLFTGDPSWAPSELVGLDFTLPQPPGTGWFFASSNGLASGNNADEALVHALCEVIERDRRSRFAGLPRLRIGTRVDVRTITDERLNAMLDLLDDAGMDFGIWDLSLGREVPVLQCTICERESAGRLSARLHTGSGCHPSSEVALSRAITEAAQMRLTYLTGARDDQGYEFFDTPATTAPGLAGRRQGGGKAFDAIASFASAAPALDLAFLLQSLQDDGCSMIYSRAFSLADAFGPEPPAIAVARVVVPGLAGPPEAYNAHLLGAGMIV